VEGLSSVDGWDPINRLNPTICVCLSQDRTWIPNVIYWCLFWCTVNEGESYSSGADPEFQVRGSALKNCAERREARKLLGYFV
jgi:hypothetical protein